MIYLKVCVVGKDRVRIAGVAHKEHVGKLELGLRHAVIGSYRKVSEGLVVVGHSVDLAVVIKESKCIGRIAEAEFLKEDLKEPCSFTVIAGEG